MTARTVVPAFALLALALPSIAQAQPGDSARAEALFETAMKLQDARLYEEACPKFAESKRLAPGIGVTLHLADCYERLGHKASAWHEFREAQRMALERHDKRADVAAAHAHAIEPQINRLTIAPPAGEKQTADAGTVLLDGAPVSPEDLGHPLAVDPGEHTITVNSPGRVSQTISALVGADALTTTVMLDPAPASAASLPAAPSAPLPTPAVADAGVNEFPTAQPAGHWIGAELIGVGLAGIGVGAVLVPSNKVMSTDSPCDPPSKRLSNWVPSIVAFSAGAAAVGAGLIIYLTAPKPKSVALVVTAAPLLGGAAATVQADF